MIGRHLLRDGAFISVVDCGRKPSLLSWYFRVLFLNSEVRGWGLVKARRDRQLLTFSMGCKHQKSPPSGLCHPASSDRQDVVLSCTLFSNLGPLETGSKGLETSVGFALCAPCLAWCLACGGHLDKK